jgi:hypothetical protein
MNSRGLHLVEVMIAAALVAVPLLISVHLIHMNTLGARFNRDRATARLVLLDLAALLQGENVDDLRDTSAAGRIARPTLRSPDGSQERLDEEQTVESVEWLPRDLDRYPRVRGSRDCPRVLGPLDRQSATASGESAGRTGRAA